MTRYTIKGILDEIGRDYYYLLHLRHSRHVDEPSHKRLWEFAKTNGLIGLDYSRGPDVNCDWRGFSQLEKEKITRWWQHQFDLFYGIDEGDCIVVPDGQTQFLGIAIAGKGPVKFRPTLQSFFRHVRKVDWLKAFDWEDRPNIPIELWFQGFRNTIQRIDSKSDYWKTTSFEIDLDRNVLSKSSADDKRALRKKYGPKGEGRDHKALKNWILNHPEEIGLHDVIRGHLEYEFHAGDRADLMFDLHNKRYAVVEIETDNADLISIGAFQALKYRVLKCAEIGADINSDRVSSYLVAWVEPDDTKFCRDYGISFIKKRV